MTTIPKNKDVPVKEAPATRRPEHTFREGDVSASIWSREVVYNQKPATFYSTSFERSYVDRNGKRQYTNSFGLDHLGVLIALANMANEYIRSKQPTMQEA